jgi:hypothetical protein
MFIIVICCYFSLPKGKCKQMHCHICDVTLSVYPHRASLKNMPGHGGNRLLPQNCWQQQLESIVATELATQNPDFLVFPMIFQ